MRTLGAVAPLLASCVAASWPAGCSSTTTSTQQQHLDRDTLLDPATCQACHVTQYQQWAASMHAYASDDPVFRAMNARGQRETKGQLGSFCIKCHAPVALAEGATSDGTNLAGVPQKLRGVTCFFCHTIDSVTGTHDAAVSLAGDLTMRGEYSDPVANTAHASSYSVLHDRDHAEGSGLCGACHDIVSPAGAHIERTYAEWLSSIFRKSGGATCGQCHMPESTTQGPIAQVAGQSLPARYSHGHDFPAVDVAVEPGFPSDEDAVKSFLGTSLQTALCVTQQGGVRVLVDNVAAGHFWPSGAVQDRRAWAEVVASRGGKVIYQSGVVPAATPVTQVQNDPDLWLMRDCMFDAEGSPVDMFWQAASEDGNELPVSTTLVMTDPAYYGTHVYQRFPRAMDAALPEMPDQVTMQVHLQPIGLDVLDDLVQSGDLAPSVRDAMGKIVFDVTPVVTWTPKAANGSYMENGVPVSCFTNTAYNVAADKNLAVDHTKCAP